MTDLIICRLEHHVLKDGPYSDLPSSVNFEKFWALMERFHISRNPDGKWAKKHPAARQEFGEDFLKQLEVQYFHEIKFGFKSLTQMEEWFGMEFIALAKDFGFQIGYYRAPLYSCLVGERQVVFVAKKAVEVRHG